MTHPHLADLRSKISIAEEWLFTFVVESEEPVGNFPQVVLESHVVLYILYVVKEWLPVEKIVLIILMYLLHMWTSNILCKNYLEHLQQWSK